MNSSEISNSHNIIKSIKIRNILPTGGKSILVQLVRSEAARAATPLKTATVERPMKAEKQVKVANTTET